MNFTEWVVLGLIAALLTLIGVGIMRNDTPNFKEVCTAAGGTTIWDGRQWQCIRR